MFPITHTQTPLERGHMLRTGFVIVLVLISTFSAAPTLVAATEEPRFEASARNHVLVPGQTQQLSITLINDAKDADDTVEKATNVKATMKNGNTPITINTGPRYLGTLVDGRPTVTSFSVSVPKDIESGVYSIPIKVTYEYEGDERETTTVHVSVRIKDRATFKIVRSNESVSVGNDGTITVTIKNTGSQPANNASVNIRSKTRVVLFDGTRSASRFVGDWGVGETRTVTYSVTVTKSAAARGYPVIATVKFDDTDGFRRQSGPLPTSVTPGPEQTFSIKSVDSSFQVGDDGNATVLVTNTGEKAVEAATLELLRTGTNIKQTQVFYPIGRLEPGESLRVNVSASVSPKAEGGTREFITRIRYNSNDGDRLRGETHVTTVDIEPEPPFSITSIDSSLQVANDGNVTLQITNTGDRIVHDATLEVVRTGPNIQQTQIFYPIGTLGPGESGKVNVSAKVSSEAEAGTREFTARIRYTADDGDRLRGSVQVTTVRVAGQQSITLRVVESDLRVGREGVMKLSITNNGPFSIEKANLRLSRTAASIHPEQTEYAIGTLEPGESTTASFSIDVAETSASTPRQFTLRLTYADRGGDRVSTPINTVRVDIAPDKPLFDIEVIDGDVPVGGSKSITLRVTNTGDETLQGIDAKAFTDAPLTVPDDSAYIRSLRPGESQLIEYRVAAPGDALTKDYPVSMDFQYTDADGETELTETYDIPVTVTEATGLIDSVVGFYYRLKSHGNIIAGLFGGLGIAGLVLGTITFRNRWREDE
ncbi:MAG: COG1361 S-layer family protein [Halodesulfurarchaeum sp.]